MAARLGAQGDLRRGHRPGAGAFRRLRHGRGLRLHDGAQGAAASPDAARGAGAGARLPREGWLRTTDIGGAGMTDLILTNGTFTTLDRANPQTSAVAIADGRFTAV